MSILQGQIGSILEIMVSATVTEISKVIEGTASSEVPTTGENASETPNEQLTQLTSFMEILAKEAVDKIYKLFNECSSVLHLEVSRSQTENEDLKKRLDAVETELRTVLEGSGGQENMSANGCCSEVKIIHQLKGTQPGLCAGDAEVKRSPILHLWKGRVPSTVNEHSNMEDTIESVIIKEEGFEEYLYSSTSDPSPFIESQAQELSDPENPTEDPKDKGGDAGPKTVDLWCASHLEVCITSKCVPKPKPYLSQCHYDRTVQCSLPFQEKSGCFNCFLNRAKLV
ncbi:hypothetical protein J4Q44_G00329840 [Coregonus suidteri]|uniref:Uncharacterized protein n=1 Tax=Coregonus suidteri TaxID=861788 RepID=A0AAN8QPJ6_9TELE